MLFGVLSYNHKGFVTVIEGNIDKESYIETLNNLVVPFINSTLDRNKIEEKTKYYGNAPHTELKFIVEPY